MKIGDTPAEVAENIARVFRYRHHPEWEMAISASEKILFGIGCPRCGSDLLCKAETGFPASGPHPERLGTGRAVKPLAEICTERLLAAGFTSDDPAIEQLRALNQAARERQIVRVELRRGQFGQTRLVRLEDVR